MPSTSEFNKSKLIEVFVQLHFGAEKNTILGGSWLDIKRPNLHNNKQDFQEELAFVRKSSDDLFSLYQGLNSHDDTDDFNPYQDTDLEPYTKADAQWVRIKLMERGKIKQKGQWQVITPEFQAELEVFAQTRKQPPKPAPAKVDRPKVDDKPKNEEAKVAKGLSTLNAEENAELAALEAEFLSMSKAMRSGLDPQMVAVGFKIGTLYVKAGKRKFAQIIETMVGRLGMSYDELQPYARNAYNQIRDDMELRGEDVSDMDTAAEVVEQVKRAKAGLAKSEKSGTIAPVKKEEVPNVPRSDASPDRTEPDQSGETSEGVVEQVSKLRQRRDKAGAGERGDGSRDGSASVSGSNGTSASRRDSGSNSGLETPQNHVIEFGGLAGKGGEKTRARGSVAAIRTLKALNDEGRFATPTERETLAKYGGAGTLAAALPRSDGSVRFEDINSDLKSLLTDKEMATLSRTSQYAFYTAEPVLRSMWALSQRLGFKGGKVYEPGILAESQDEYYALAIKDEVFDGQNYMTSLWEPTPEEVKMINCGGSVLLRIMGTVHPPVQMSAQVAPGVSEG